MARFRLALFVLCLAPGVLGAKPGRPRPEPKEAPAERDGKAAPLNKGQLFYNLVRTSADDLPEAVSANAHEAFAHRRLKALTSAGFAAYVSSDEGRPLCILQTRPGAPKAREAFELGLRLPQEMVDVGCSGSMRTVRLDWGGGRSQKYTQRELDLLFMVFKDALGPLLRQDAVDAK